MSETIAPVSTAPLPDPARPSGERRQPLVTWAARVWTWARAYRAQLLVALLGVAFDVAFTTWFVLRERTVYVWDFAYYWTTAINVSHSFGFDRDNSVALHAVLASVRNNEYNLLTAVPQIPVLKIFGESRLTFVLSILIMYAIPAAAVLAALLQKVTERLWPSGFRKSWVMVGLFLLIVTNPVMLIAVLRGFPDIIGLIPFGAALWLYARYRRRLSFRAAIGIALLLLTATLLRRWYLFGAAGAFVGIAIDQVALAVAARQLRARVAQLTAALVVPLVFGALFVLVAWPYVHLLLTKDYSNEYASFKVHDNYGELAWFSTIYFGAVYLVPVVAGWLLLALRRQVAALLVVLGGAVSFFAVGYVQTFSGNHYYLLTPAVLVGLAAAIAGACRVAGRRWAAVGAVTVALYAAMFVGIYHPVTVGAVLPQAAPPVQRKDTAALERLYNDLGQADRGPQSIYVLVCSDRLNKSTILNLPLSFPVARRIDESSFMPSPDLDLRDGFNQAFFDAPWVVDANPPGYIAADPTQQSVVTLLHQAVNRGGPLAAYYRVTRTYRLDGGDSVFLLERTSPIPVGLRAHIIDQVRQLHSGAMRIW